MHSARKSSIASIALSFGTLFADLCLVRSLAGKLASLGPLKIRTALRSPTGLRIGILMSGTLVGFGSCNLGHPTQQERDYMDWNRVEGNWKQLKGKVKEKWGKLTDDDLDVINGRRDQLEGKIQERYGIQKDQVKKDIDTWYGEQRW